MALTFTPEELEQMSIVAIRNYLNKDFTDNQIKKHFGIAIKLISESIQQSKGINKNVKSKTQGDRSITYADEYKLITPYIAIYLPTPYVKMY
ncbi:hypothetical protein FDB55_06795 [Clostridium botulinum]|uniref:hypothetical protein n=1 Tax=Clostridium botulinum TaxID=1491 RepID=UPI0013F01E0D|nr:hypothetical protein [Clostridium botulinum]MCS6110380.1 hypothetical protein [Clostridium botulinum]NFE13121.1 hypothetical protein [Clostridium botulinum]NFL42213.1 hypothetical protein [Clostridium botulinum]NFN21446.1 hypothetical protein [Clostridium botulinum]NFN42657.1 hypothetical protein [Clostridium botulinum]